MRRISVVLLVDAEGRVLLQERDEHAPLSPEKWGMVGGHVEDGEDFEPAAYRELEEETGVRLESGLRLWREEWFRYSDRRRRSTTTCGWHRPRSATRTSSWGRAG